MTNKFYTESAVISVNIVNMDNKLSGAWVSLPIKKLDFRDFLFTIGNPEKVKIQDYKDNLGLDGLKIGEYMSLKELNELAKKLEKIKNESMINAFNALYEELGNVDNALEHLEYFN